MNQDSHTVSWCISCFLCI